MAWQQQGYNQNHGGGQGYGQSNQYGQQQQFNQHQQYAAQVLYGGQSQGYNQGNNWSAGPSNMNKGPGHFGNSHRNPNYGYGEQRYNGQGGNQNQHNLMPHRGQRPMSQNNRQTQRQKDPHKPINATEVKSYINAWATKQKLKPEYSYKQEGQTPFVLYKCTLSIGQYDCQGEGAAKSKKQAQTIAAWDMSEKLAAKGVLNLSEVPPIPENLLGAHATKTANRVEGNNENVYVEYGEEYGGWTTETARQRLNRFCMQLGIGCNIINHVTGPPHARVTSASLSLIIERLNKKVLQVQVNAPNKKSANAKCSMEMLKQLFALNLIEKKGEPEMKLLRKRKNEITWTRTTAPSRLKKFKEENSGDSSFGISESSAFQNGQFTISTVINCKGIKIEAQASEPSEEEAKISVAVMLANKLCVAGLIEANLPVAKSKKSKEEYLANIRQTNIVMVPRFNNTGRNTPGDDRQLKKKLLDLEQKETYKRLRVNTMNKITKCLKESESYPQIENLHRIGEFFKGLELADETEDLELVVVSKEKPTNSFVNEVLSVLASLEGFTADRYEDFLYLTTKEKPEVSIYVTFTSAAFYPPDGKEECADPEGMILRDGCVNVWIRLQRCLFLMDRCHKLFNSLAVLRVLKFLARDAEMDGFSGWLMELFVIRALETAHSSEPAGDALRRVFSILSGGILLPNVSSLIDLNGTDDLLDQLTVIQRNKITAKAHTYLRLQTFKQLHKVLGIDFVQKKSSLKIEEPKPTFNENDNSVAQAN